MILLAMAKRERSVRLSPLPSRRLLISFDIGPLSIGLALWMEELGDMWEFCFFYYIY